MRGGSSKTITLDYLGDVREITASGYKPRGGTISFSGKSIIITGGNFLFNDGDTTATMTLTLAETNEYKSATATITMSVTGQVENNFDIIGE